MYFRFVTHGGDDPFWAVVQQGAYDAASLLGCQVDFDLCGGDMSLQLKRFQEAVALKPDGIALVINDDVAWDKPVEDALAAGIPVVGINNDDTEGAAGNARLCYIGQSEKRAAYTLARKLFQEAESKGIDLSQAHDPPRVIESVSMSSCLVVRNLSSVGSEIVKPSACPRLTTLILCTGSVNSRKWPTRA